MNTMSSEEELKAEVDRLRAENEALKRPARGQMSLKVSEKGALSVYGLGRFPVTLYREQWEKLLGLADGIRQFIQENDHLRSEEHTSELQSLRHLVCRLLLEKKQLTKGLTGRGAANIFTEIKHNKLL